MISQKVHDHDPVVVEVKWNGVCNCNDFITKRKEITITITNINKTKSEAQAKNKKNNEKGDGVVL